MNTNELTKKPIFFKQNRVYRNYLGGKGFSALCGDNSTDGIFPEEWICSKVKAINPKYFGPRDGVSIVENTDIYFDDLLEIEKDNLLGNRKYDCLVKYLDSAIRLPVQVHPTKEFSRKNFNSEYGKTEAWLVLSTRDDAKIYFGFKDKIDLKTLEEYADKSLEERDILSTIITYTNAKVGDVFIIKAGLIHAIGKGCTILEVQEPTDFTIQIENWCGDNRVTEQEKYLGLEKETALSCFNFNEYGKEALERARCIPKTEYKKDGVKKEILISYDDTPCFSENRYIINGGECLMNYGPSVWCIVDGNGEIVGEDYSHTLNKGNYFFLPYAAEGKYKIKGNLTAVECLPSKQ